MQGLIESEDLSSSEFGSDEERNLLEKDNTQGILDSNTVGKRINDSTSSYNLVERRSRREFEPMRARNRQDLEPTRARNRQELETTRARYRQELEPAERDYDSPSPSPSVLIIESEEPSVLIIETAERNYYPCDLCSCIMEDQIKLRAHMQRVHTGLNFLVVIPLHAYDME